MKNAILKLFLSIFLLAIFSFAYSQSWEKTFSDTTNFGHANGYDVIETNDGYVMVGELDLPTGAPRHYIWLLKTDFDGNLLWSNIYDGGDVAFNQGKALTETPNGDLLIVGADFENAIVFKTTAEGDSLWTKEFGGNGQSSFHDIVQTSNDTYMIVGKSSNENNGPKEIMAVEINSEGDSLWSSTYFMPANFGTSAYDISNISPDHALITGGYEGQSFAIKLNKTTKETIWEKSYILGTDTHFFSGSGGLNNDGLLMGGKIIGFAGYSPILVETDANGENLNQISFTTISFGVITSIHPTMDNGFILTGSSYEFWAGTPDDAGFITKLNSSFEVEWETNYEGSSTIQGAEIRQNSDGSFIMAGSKEGNLFLKKIAGPADAVNEITEDINLNLFPNPGHGVFKLAFSDAMTSSNLELSLFDSKGIYLETKKIQQNPAELNFRYLPSGIYFYKISTSKNQLATGKIIIQ